jgi:hypothetical protein
MEAIIVTVFSLLLNMRGGHINANSFFFNASYGQTKIFGENRITVPFCLSQISHGLAQD